jgi:hypothetical protein
MMHSPGRLRIDRAGWPEGDIQSHFRPAGGHQAKLAARKSPVDLESPMQIDSVAHVQKGRVASLTHLVHKKYGLPLARHFPVLQPR